MADKMVEMVALTTIETTTGKVIATGEMDANGLPGLRHESRVIPQGSRFCITREEADQLLRMDAADEVEP